MPPALFTLGHSNRALDGFLALLDQYKITALADVRSVPYSRRHPQFNRGPLGEALRTRGIEYIFLGQELGGRPKDRSSSVSGRAEFRRIAATAPFKDGLERVKLEMRKGSVPALMCAEKDPMTCHRAILVCRNLRGEGFEIRHIIDREITETQEELEKRLVAHLKLQPDLFRDAGPDSLVERAYDLQADRMAHAGKGGQGAAPPPDQ